MSPFPTDGSNDSSSVDKSLRSMRFFNVSTCLGNGFATLGDNFFFGVGAKSLSDDKLSVGLRFSAFFVGISTFAVGFLLVDVSVEFDDEDDATALLDDFIFGSDFLDVVATFVGETVDTFVDIESEPFVVLDVLDGNI